jgi:antitoxin YefM
MSETLPFSEVKARLSALAERVEREHDRIVVTRHGRPAFVLVNPDDLESLEETVEILQDEDLLASLRRSREEAAAGQAVSLKRSQ